MCHHQQVSFSLHTDKLTTKTVSIGVFSHDFRIRTVLFRKLDVLQRTAEDISSQTGNKVGNQNDLRLKVLHQRGCGTGVERLCVCLQVHALQCDVRDPQDVSRCVDEMEALTGLPDVTTTTQTRKIRRRHVRSPGSL